jgi:hypothetical protein
MPAQYLFHRDGVISGSGTGSASRYGLGIEVAVATMKEAAN